LVVGAGSGKTVSLLPQATDIKVLLEQARQEDALAASPIIAPESPAAGTANGSEFFATD
jgi:hypothetical protein